MCSLHAFDGNCVRGKHNGKSGDIPAYFSAPPVRDVTAPLSDGWKRAWAAVIMKIKLAFHTKHARDAFQTKLSAHRAHRCVNALGTWAEPWLRERQRLKPRAQALRQVRH